MTCTNNCGTEEHTLPWLHCIASGCIRNVHLQILIQHATLVTLGSKSTYIARTMDAQCQIFCRKCFLVFIDKLTKLYFWRVKLEICVSSKYTEAYWVHFKQANFSFNNINWCGKNHALHHNIEIKPYLGSSSYLGTG